MSIQKPANFLEGSIGTHSRTCLDNFVKLTAG
jgi:hypothetical protein